MTTRRKTLVALTGISAMATWHKPIINSIVTPAHAQTSPMDPPVDPPVDPVDPLPSEVCPMITTGNLVSSSVSGANSLIACSATFEILSSDAAASLTIISIDNSALTTGATITVQDLGAATDSSGPRVSWTGPSADAPTCSNPQPTDDITFTVTATCAAASALSPSTFTQEFLLSAILT